jgi:DnaJ family protein C protein 3
LELELFEDAVRTLKEASEIHEGSNAIRQLLNEANTLLRRSKQKDYYKVLGVARDADERDIKRAYRKLVKEFHPDKVSSKGVSKEAAQTKITAINEAYETLSDPELRARVDRGEDPNDPQQQQGGHPFQGSPFGHGGQQFVFRSGPGGFGGGSDGGFQFQFPGGFPG